MSSFKFSSLKVPDLQQFLNERGVTASKLNKDKLVQLCIAVEAISLPLDPDFAKSSSVADLQQKISLLPISDPFNNDDFTDDFSEIPAQFTLFDIFNYLLFKTSDYDKKKLKAYKSCEDYRLFFDGHVEELSFNKCGSADICVFRANVKPTQREKTNQNMNFYRLWFSMRKSSGEILSAYCNCIGGADGACRHLSAALYELENFEIKSVTDGENKWHKRPRAHDCPVPIKRLKIVKAKYCNLNEGRVECEIDTFDPRHVADRNTLDINDIANQLRQIQPDFQALDILAEKSTVHHPTPAPYEECMQFSVKQTVQNFITDHNVHDASTYLNELRQLSDSTVNKIEIATRGQSKSSLWMSMRYGMITASNFEKVCQAVDKNSCPPSLIKTLLGKYHTDIQVPSLEWGRKKESVACDLYMRVSRQQHKKVVMQEQGLLIKSDFPYIGCSVDDLFSCKCHGTKLIEIKCPFSHKNSYPQEVALLKGCKISNEKSVVLESSEYYCQMQGQMGIYGINSSELVIYTTKGIHVASLDFNKKFFDEMISKITHFFSNFLWEKIVHDIKEHDLTKK